MIETVAVTVAVVVVLVAAVFVSRAGHEVKRLAEMLAQSSAHAAHHRQSLAVSEARNAELEKALDRERRTSRLISEQAWSLLGELPDRISRAYESARLPVIAPPPPPAVHIPREADAEERLGRMITEDTIQRAVSILRDMYKAQGLTVSEEHLRKEATAASLGEPMPTHLEG